MVTWDKTISRKIYEKRFFEGQRFVKIVADLLKTHGFEVRTPLQRVKALRKANKDSGDIHIMDGENIRFNLEVKSRGLTFTCIEDYPYARVFIDNINQWNAKKHRVAAVIIISQPTEKMIVVPISSRKNWKEEEVTDPEKAVRVWKYSVNKMYCISFEELIQKLRDKLNG